MNIAFGFYILLIEIIVNYLLKTEKNAVAFTHCFAVLLTEWNEQDFVINRSELIPCSLNQEGLISNRLAFCHNHVQIFW